MDLENLRDDDGEGDVGMEEAGEEACPVCLSTSGQQHPCEPNQLMPFVRTNKDLYCHIAHMLLWGETSWSVFGLQATLAWQHVDLYATCGMWDLHLRISNF